MCGIIGVTGIDHAARELYEGLIALQHRGQDATGIVTFDHRFHEVRKEGLVMDVMTAEVLDSLRGEAGVGHNRYATIGEGGPSNSQPFHNIYPFPITKCHNGNVTNYTKLRAQTYMDSSCDLEAILYVFIDGVVKDPSYSKGKVSKKGVYAGVKNVMDKVDGSYSVVSYVPEVGMLAYRDPFGIKPLVIGRKETSDGPAYCFASETVALTALEYEYIGSVGPGEAVIIDKNRKIHRKQISTPTIFTPCIFELIYFSRAASLIEGISVSGFRYELGKELARIAQVQGFGAFIDFITDVPSTATRGAVAFAQNTGTVFRQAFDRNNYIGRSFIQSSEAERRRAALLKFAADMGLLRDMTKDLGRSVHIGKVDDSFVRGITNFTINKFLRDTGFVEYIYDASCAPRIEWPCPYGIDMSIRKEFVARGRTDEEVAEAIGSDRILYMTRDSLRNVAGRFGLGSYCEACFSGEYPTGLTEDDLKRIETERIRIKNCSESQG
ncbi:amidophosphoribosyltransferase [Candidatus Woesearchaeota archaeon]|nr:amidophosphoribosyltransferase [Candidatus Woesearchaeota archaeon]